MPFTIGYLERIRPVFEYKLYIDTFHPREVVQAVADGQADIGLVSLPIDLGRCQLLWSGQAPCVLALPSNHPLAVNDVVRLGELGDNTVITLSNRSGLRHRISTALLQTNRSEEHTSELQSLMRISYAVFF